MYLDQALNGIALLLLRTCRPLTAYRILAGLGKALPRHKTTEDMRDVAAALGERGTCLSRSMAVAARARSADVVLGVKPLQGPKLEAHAWVEIDGEPLRPWDPVGAEIVRLSAKKRG